MLFRKRRNQARAAARKAALTGFTVVDRRSPLVEITNSLLRKAFPDHWSFLLGELALYSLLVLVLTGSWLTLFFEPGTKEALYQGSYVPLQGVPVSAAYNSTLHITFDVRGGLLIRQMHHWASLIFVAAICVHMLRIFFTGSFRRPREINWTIGVALFFLAFLEGFCGYSLPDDLLSGTGLRTANTIVMSIPVLGTYLAYFLWDGQFPGQLLNNRLYILHVLFVPGVIIGLVLVHLILVVYLKHTQWSSPGRTNHNVVGQPMFPHFIAKSTGLFLMVFAVLATLGAVAQINPVWNYGPYRADQAPTGVQPDWYVGFLEGALRLMPPWETSAAGHTVMWNVLLPAVVLPGLLAMLLIGYPIFERWVTGDRGEYHLCDRPRDMPNRTAFGVAAIVGYAVLLIAGGNDVTAFSFQLSVNVLTWVFRIGFFVFPVLAFLLTKRLCLALQSHELRLLSEGEETGEVVQNVYGAMEPGHAPVAPARLYRFLARDLPSPAACPDEAAPRRQRLWATLNRWYYRRRVALPASPVQQRRVEEALAQPQQKAP
ncbi:cytochrome bc complex cytochrome b subunit [Streptomyces sp. NPDC006703]|uniref:cytochrome bc1 complex cytochrome b subunit n=1 Tax=Streptomyces sp. NPDC006703 TaxID=3364759 RepID=UPI0036A664C3